MAMLQRLRCQFFTSPFFVFHVAPLSRGLKKSFFPSLFEAVFTPIFFNSSRFCSAMSEVNVRFWTKRFIDFSNMLGWLDRMPAPMPLQRFFSMDSLLFILTLIKNNNIFHLLQDFVVPYSSNNFALFLQENSSYGGCEGPNATYVKLISSDGHEFIVKREHALTSGTIKAM